MNLYLRLLRYLARAEIAAATTRCLRDCAESIDSAQREAYMVGVAHGEQSGRIAALEMVERSVRDRGAVYGEQTMADVEAVRKGWLH